MTSDSSEEDEDMDATSPLVLAIMLGLVASGLALFIAAVFSMGYALQEPMVVVPIMAGGSILSLMAWAILNDKKRTAESEDSKHHRPTPMRHMGATRRIMLFWCGAMLSLALFLVVVLVENQFPGEEKSDVFGPYYTHPFRPLSGIVLCLLGLATGAVLYPKYKMRACALGLSFGSVALGLLLILAK